MTFETRKSSLVADLRKLEADKKSKASMKYKKSNPLATSEADENMENGDQEDDVVSLGHGIEGLEVKIDINNVEVMNLHESSMSTPKNQRLNSQ
jgi:hypothetical protein